MIDDRGQSELVGTMLLVGIVVISVTVFGGYALAWFTDSATSGGPNVSLDVEVNESAVVLTHGGGRTLERSDVTVILRGDGGDEGFGLESVTIGNGNAEFEPGEHATGTHSLTGTFDVLVVHEPANQVIYRETVRIGTPPGGPSTPGTTTPPGTATPSTPSTPTPAPSTPTPTPGTPTATPTPTPTSAPTQPSVTIDGVTISQPSNQEEQVTVDWSASDPDGDLSSVEITVEDLEGSCSPQSTTNEVSGGSASGTDVFTFDAHPGQGCGPGDSYQVTVTAWDADGNFASEEITQTE